MVIVVAVLAGFSVLVALACCKVAGDCFKEEERRNGTGNND